MWIDDGLNDPRAFGGVMAKGTGKDTTLELRLPESLTEVLERAAAIWANRWTSSPSGALARTAREVVAVHGETVLTGRDWERVLALIDDINSEPSPALRAAAARYEKWLGREQSGRCS